MKEAELMNLPPKGDVRASIEARQRRRPAPPAGEGNAMRFTPAGIVYVDVEGREVQPTPDPAWQQRLARKRAVDDAREAFEAAVLADFASTPGLYVAWFTAHLRDGGNGISPFAEAVETVLMKVVDNR